MILRKGVYDEELDEETIYKSGPLGSCGRNEYHRLSKWRNADL